MRVSRLVHGAFVGDLVLDGEINARVLLRRGTSARDEDLVGRERDGGGALVELGGVAVVELLDGPLILVDVVAERDLGVDVVAEEVDLGLVLGALRGLEGRRLPC